MNPHATHIELVQPARDLLVHRLLRVERIPALVDVGQDHRIANPQRPRIGLLLPENQLEQRRLPGSVGTNDSDNPPTRQPELHVLEQQPISERLRQPLRFDDQFPQRTARRNLNIRSVFTGVVLLGGHLLIASQARLVLRLARLGRHPHPLQLFLERLLSLRLLLLFQRQPTLLLLQPGRVVPLVRNAAAAVEFQNPTRHVVEEVPVVRHRDDRPLEVPQEMLQPIHRFRVEMVGRLIEQQHVRILQQQLAERHPPLFTPGEMLHQRIGRRQTHRIGREFHRAVQLPQIPRVDLVLHPRQLREHIFHRLGRQLFAQLHVEVVVVFEYRPRDRHPFFDALGHRRLGVQPGLLREIADVDPLHWLGGAHEVFVFTGHDFQQGRLPRPVDPQDPDLGTGIKRQPDVRQNRLLVDDLRDAFHLEDVLLTHVEIRLQNSS